MPDSMIESLLNFMFIITRVCVKRAFHTSLLPPILHTLLLPVFFTLLFAYVKYVIG